MNTEWIKIPSRAVLDHKTGTPSVYESINANLTKLIKRKKLKENSCKKK